MVPRAGLEPARPKRTVDFKSTASTNSATPARKADKKMEATPGLEPGIRALQAPALPLGHVASNRDLKVRGEYAPVNLPASRTKRL